LPKNFNVMLQVLDLGDPFHTRQLRRQVGGRGEQCRPQRLGQGHADEGAAPP
jgi:hypothetical protein